MKTEVDTSQVLGFVSDLEDTFDSFTKDYKTLEKDVSRLEAYCHVKKSMEFLKAYQDVLLPNLKLLQKKGKEHVTFLKDAMHLYETFESVYSSSEEK